MGKTNRTDEIQGKIIHEYDGIEEADNDLPKWWLFSFYVTIVFAVGYWFYYHEFSINNSLMDEYQTELAATTGGDSGEVSAAYLEAVAKDPVRVAKGKEVFASNCVACHLAQGQGDIGPNLTDAYWLHGGSAVDIYDTVANGVLDKGMVAWLGPLGRTNTENVTAYVLGMRNTNVDGKEPQGEEYIPGAEPSAIGDGSDADGGVEDP